MEKLHGPPLKISEISERSSIKQLDARSKMLERLAARTCLMLEIWMLEGTRGSFILELMLEKSLSSI